MDSKESRSPISYLECFSKLEAVQWVDNGDVKEF